MGNHCCIGSTVASVVRRMVCLTLCCVILTAATACQVAPAVSSKRLAEHREVSDLSGLQPSQILEQLKVSWSVPGKWEAMPLRKNLLYTHQQWRSPSLATGVGVAHIEMPLPIPAQAIIWFAKAEYAKRFADQSDGKIISQWTDSLGRQWFEAENSKYHIKGYAITRGTEAWIVYSGYRMSRDPVPQEIALAEKSLDSVVPTN